MKVRATPIGKESGRVYACRWKIYLSVPEEKAREMPDGTIEFDSSDCRYEVLSRGRLARIVGREVVRALQEERKEVSS